MTELSEKILTLREEGLSYRQIERELGCSKATISYHCGKRQKDKADVRRKNYKNSHPFIRKFERFISKRINKDKVVVNPHLPFELALKHKVDRFHRSRKGDRLYEKRNFYARDVVEKFGKDTTCYLTGEPIDIQLTSEYHFDHIIPISKGGGNSLSNLGICTKDANQSKTDMTVDEYLDLCKKVLEHNGYKVSKD